MKPYGVVLMIAVMAAWNSMGAKPPTEEPVAAGFPAWTGVVEKNYIFGRKLLSPSDLRQRVTIVVEFDADKAAEQLEQTGYVVDYFGQSTLPGEGNWEAFKMPRDIIILYVARNAKSSKKVAECLKNKDHQKESALTSFIGCNASIYSDVTFEGAPDGGGKFPFVYIMPREGVEPLYKAECGPKVAGEIRKVLQEQRSKATEQGLAWRPYLGYVSEPKHFADIEAALVKGKPLKSYEEKLRKGIKSQDPETAREAQMLYDALAQTRSDYCLIVQSSAWCCPHVAAYYMKTALRFWPQMKKLFADAEGKISSNAAFQPLVKVYAKAMECSDERFVCKSAGDAKKVVAELQKMKKQIAPLKDATRIALQNSALVVDGMLDGLIESVPSKVK